MERTNAYSPIDHSKTPHRHLTSSVRLRPTVARVGLGAAIAGAVAMLAACGGSGGASSGTSSAAGQTNSTSITPIVAAGGEALTCGAPSAPTNAASTSGDAVEADTPGSDGSRTFALGSNFQIALTTRTSQSDTLAWQVRDNWNVVRASGTVPVQSGAHSVTLDCSSTLAGYFAISATLAKESSQLPARGTRPAGVATFGVRPDVSATLPAASFARQDQHRFGGQGANYLIAGQTCCSGDGYRPLYADLGLAWANDNRNWYMEEPNGPNTFVPGTGTLAPYFRNGDISRLIQLDGIPGWASPTGAQTLGYAPASESAFQDYASRVGTDSALIRAAYFPNQAKNYYQITWEPDGGGSTKWLDSDANLVAMYAAAYTGLHSTDPNAVVMGVTAAILRTNTQWLARLAPLGLAQYLDGLTVHGYYDAGTSPSHPPERLATDPDPATAANALPASMRELRSAMAKYLKPGAKLFATETGISYDTGATYGSSYPTQDILFAQGAVVARTHLILLGEGADMTYVFYSSDSPDDTPGYGLFFDLSSANGSYGSSNISPKPAAMAVAAMTRIVDGTSTIGYLNGVPAGVYGYAFQRLGGGKIVTALWTHNNAVWSASAGFSASYSVPYTLQVDDDGTSGQVTVLDAMGNAASMPYSNGRITLSLTEAPLYVVSANAAVAKANATVPTGYVAQ
ncbi:hypothetical protein WKR88_00955 [Trinickia caryophylli]|uniref:Uncharacterized protein n=1 Tax=Trinickia caryophylli TaxID=28094 RepID=A0A1X7CG04_TRICW|nr:hypothetical protein [Trinickia caryophylli]PMS11610.1 hypothetical protein C0Z17_14235 [Trinickia caryophylli]TRX19831.1 hypothetical protein FNF07_17550 [Trinickia caryophylli]WQE12838.1 hypothetical protein U0034_05410 [Trinickia caryophylli]SME95681.1 hypothetical protein SAMN06295900_101326 [Trinickia caryophylli]GLU30559.1 hypothetical protein Busp01_04010 [Trinickia caryophylli]